MYNIITERPAQKPKHNAFIFSSPFPIIDNSLIPTVPTVPILPIHRRHHMPVTSKHIQPLRMRPAELRHGTWSLRVSLHSVPDETAAFQICAPHAVTGGHVLEHEAVQGEPEIGCVPVLPGGAADCPDCAITDAGVVWIGVVWVPVTHDKYRLFADYNLTTGCASHSSFSQGIPQKEPLLSALMSRL